jgi:hypothetical protein
MEDISKYPWINWFTQYRSEIMMIGLAFLVIFIGLAFFKVEDSYLESLKPILSKILDKAGYHKIKCPTLGAEGCAPTTKTFGTNLLSDRIYSEFPIQLRKSSKRTYTIDKQKIYVVSEKSNGEKYNQDTLLFVILHEIAHILSPDEHHTKGFHQIEKRLHKAAIDLGYIHMNLVDKNYPCHK